MDSESNGPAWMILLLFINTLILAAICVGVGYIDYWFYVFGLALQRLGRTTGH